MDKDDHEVLISQRLAELQRSYASSLDARDATGLLAVFQPDACLRIFEPGAHEPSSESHGHQILELMVEAMTQRYERTLHTLTNETFRLEDGIATGEVYCVAHHLIREHGGMRKFVAYLVYKDTFQREPADKWRISQRDIHFQWAEEVSVLAWEEAKIIGRLS